MSTLTGIYAADQAGAVAAFANWMGSPPDLASVHGGESSLSDYESIDYDMWVNGWSGAKCVSLPLIWAGASLADAASGACDAGWTAAVQHMVGQESFQGINGHPKQAVFFVRIGWEQNGGWMKWATQNNGQGGNYIAAFQRLVGIVRGLDAANRIRIVWCPNIGQDPAEQTYPGDAYVDVVSLDFYWQPQYGDPADPAAAFAFMRSRTNGLDWQVAFAAAHGKQLAVSEWGIEQDNAGPYINLAFAFFQANNYVFVNYWESNAAYPGKLSPDTAGGTSQYPNAAAAYKAAVLAMQQPPAAPASTPILSVYPASGATPMSATLTVTSTLAAGTYSVALAGVPLSLKMTGDSYQGAPTGALTLDGAALPSVTVTVLQGQTPQTVSLGNVDPTKAHVVTGRLTNDLYGGTPQTDRNLYCVGYTLNGQTYSGNWQSLGGETFTINIPASA